MIVLKNKREKTIDYLTSVIGQKKRIILYDYYDDELLKMLLKYIEDNMYEIEVWTSDKIKNRNSYCGFLNNDAENVMEIYDLYEFTDSAVILSDEGYFPSLVNYVSNGIITKEEMVELLLYR